MGRPVNDAARSAARTRRGDIKAVAEGRVGRALADSECFCACGVAVPMAPKTSVERGWVKGEPRCYLKGHHMRRPVEYLIDAETGCWVWQGYLDRDGYGQTWRDGAQRCAHRWYYEQAHGPLDEDRQVHHDCKNPACVNPEHLLAVSAVRHVRMRKTVKLSLGDARVIRALGAAFPRSGTQIAEAFGVAPGSVHCILRGRTWREA